MSKQILYIIITLLILLTGGIFYIQVLKPDAEQNLAASQQPIRPSQGGTGTSTVPSYDDILIGGNATTSYEVKKLVAGTNITLATSSGQISISSTGGGGGGSSKWATTSDLTVLSPNGGNTIGIIVAASSTINRLSSDFGTTTQGTSTNYAVSNSLQVGGVLSLTATPGILQSPTQIRLQINGGTQIFDFTQDLFAPVLNNQTSLGTPTNSWNAIYASSSQTTLLGVNSTFSTTSKATTTDMEVTNTLHVGGTLDVDGLTSALVLTGAGGVFAEYTGIDCTNQFVRDVSALGAGTCATVVAGDVDLADLTATDATLTFSGTYDGQTARTIGVNLTNANIWSGLQNFSNSATSTWVGAIDASGLSSDNWVSSPYFVATSTTATSTFNRLMINTSGKLGVASTSPASVLGVAGTTTTETLNVDAPQFTGTSTLYIRSKGTGLGGTVILEDTDGAGCTEIYTLNGTITGRTITCPADPLAK